ncbi:MAG: endo-1,4-beta-xylanase [Cyanobacteria bacterium P01_A01_bin.123]
MLLQFSVETDLLIKDPQYKAHVERGQGFRLKQLHQNRVHTRNGLDLSSIQHAIDWADNKLTHGGALTAPNAIPEWVRSLYRNPSEAWEAQKQWIQGIVSALPQVKYWDVANELWPTGVWMRNVPWAKQHHYWWIDESFHLAREANPNATLLIKELRPQDTSRWGVLLNYVSMARAKGVPIDGIAVQLHNQCYHPLTISAIETLLVRIKKLSGQFVAMGQEPLKILFDETIAWDTLVWSNKIAGGGYIQNLRRLFEPWQAATYQGWRDLAEKYDVEVLGFWCPTDILEDTWHNSNRKFLFEGRDYWSVDAIRANPEAWKVWRSIPSDKRETPRKQKCTPGLWRTDWGAKPALSVFPELVG